MKRFRPRHAQIHLPALNGQEACLLVAMLERAVSAVWRAHGDVMAADFQQRAVPDATTLRDDDVDGGGDDHIDIGEDDLDFWSLLQKSPANDDRSNATADSVKIFEGESYRQKQKDKSPTLLRSLPSSVRRAPKVGAPRAAKARRSV